MKYLVDNQLPPALARHLRLSGGCASQFRVKSNERIGVDSEGVRRAAEECLSPYKHDAQASVPENTLACASCLYADPAGPPLVWVRLGNCRTPTFLSAFDRVLPQLIEALEAGQKVVEIR